MKKSNVLKLSIFILSLIVVAACKKNSDQTTDKELIAKITGNYKLTALTITQGTTTVDMYATLDACEKDDVDHFNADMSYVHQDAGTQCAPSNTEAGTWQIVNGKLLAGGVLADIVTADGQKLIISATIQAGNVTSVTTQTLTKQ